MRHVTKWSAMFVIVGLLWPAHHLAAQGVTTGVIAGVVTVQIAQHGVLYCRLETTTTIEQ